MVEINIYPYEKEYQILSELYPPIPANKFLPEWYKKQSFSNEEKEFFKDTTKEESSNTHAKNCPAIQYQITNGFIIPAWCDIWIVQVDEFNYKWKIAVGGLDYVNKTGQKFLQQHLVGQDEFMDLNVPKLGVLKLISPYLITAPKGYGVRFDDPFFHHRRNIKLIPGSVDMDIWHQVNFPFEYYYSLESVENKKIIVRAGEPLIMATPYKKGDQHCNLKVNKFDPDIYKKQKDNLVLHSTVGTDWKRYKKHFE